MILPAFYVDDVIKNAIKEDINYISSVGYECVSCLAIGYKNQDPKMRPRKSLEEIIVS